MHFPLFNLFAISSLVRALVLEHPTRHPSPKKSKQRHEKIFENAQNAQRENILRKICNKNDEISPCACKSVLTNTNVRYKGELRRVEFPEYPCDVNENTKRQNKGMIDSGFACVQLRTRRFLYQDVNGQPIVVRVNFNVGCELRCRRNCESVF